MSLYLVVEVPTRCGSNLRAYLTIQVLSYTMANCTFPSLEYKTDVKSLSFIAKSLCKLGIRDFNVRIRDVPFFDVVVERVTVFEVHRITTEVVRSVFGFRET